MINESNFWVHTISSINIRKMKHKIIKLCLHITLIVSLVSCAFISETETETDYTLYPEKLTEISIEGDFPKAIIAINTSTDYSGSESTGPNPLKTAKAISPLIQANTPPPIQEPAITSPVIKASSQAPLALTPQLSKSTDPETDTFWNEVTKTTINATKIASNDATVVYIETSAWTGAENLESNIDFQNKVEQLLTYFQNTVSTNATTHLGEFSEITDVDDNGKVVILLLTMEAGLSGFFWNVDLYSNSMSGAENSNEKEMLYINIDKISNNDYHHVIAHEYTHLLGATNRLRVASNFSNYDVWIEEGLAEGLTPYLSGDNDILIRSLTDLNNIESSITPRNGEGLIKQLASQASWYTYAVSYSFFEYCRLQMNQDSDFYKELIEHSTTGTVSDYKVIDTKIKNYNSSSNTNLITNFEDALISYKIANHVKHTSNKYGYKNDTFHETNLPATFEGPTFSNPVIEPGGSLYFVQGSSYSEESINDFVPGESGDNIKFFRIIPTANNSE